MGYKVQSKIRIDLGDLGDNNGTPFFAEIKNPRMLTFGEKSSFAKFAKLENDEEKAAAMKDVAKGFIVAWNLLDLETGSPVSLTTSDALDHVPSEVVEEIFKSFLPKKQSDEIKNS